MVTTASDLAPHIPYLRQFARALTGSQDRGDHHVSSALEAIVNDPAILPSEMSARAALFRVFLKTWNSSQFDTGYRGYSADGPADGKLARVSLLPRAAFLLVSLEEFTVREAASILGQDVMQIEQLINQAADEIARQVATSVLIIEDEPLIAMDLEALAESLGHRISGVAQTKSEAIAAVEQERPGLILADIQLADGSSGLDAVNDILHAFDVPVIFVTAFPERLLTGERPEPAFLITKPFQPAVLKAVMSQALFFEQKAHHVQGA